MKTERSQVRSRAWAILKKVSYVLERKDLIYCSEQVASVHFSAFYCLFQIDTYVLQLLVI